MVGIKSISILLSSFLFLAFGCGRDIETSEKVATVNDAPISLVEFQKKVTLVTKRDPSLKLTPEVLEAILSASVDRKLLIQEAVKMGLSDDERFVESIKSVWEQTLIRHLIDQKNREWTDVLFVTVEEIKEHYGRMSHKLTVKVTPALGEKEAQEAKERMLRGEPVDGEQIMGPLFLEDIEPNNPLFKAFDLKQGQARVCRSGVGFLSIHVLKKEPVALPPLNEIYDRVRDDLLEQKKQKALDEWLARVKESAMIIINYDALKRAANE